MAAVTTCSDFKAPQIKSVTISTVSPSICHEVMGQYAMIFVFWMLSFKPTYSLSSFTCIKRVFSSSSLSAIRVISFVYLRLLIFLPAILIPACASSSLVFHMMYSAYKLNKQDDNIQPWRTPFPIWNQSVVPCPVLTVKEVGFHKTSGGGWESPPPPPHPHQKKWFGWSLVEASLYRQDWLIKLWVVSDGLNLHLCRCGGGAGLKISSL